MGFSVFRNNIFNKRNLILCVWTARKKRKLSFWKPSQICLVNSSLNWTFLYIFQCQESIIAAEDIKPNSVHMALQIPQYFFITVGEVMFSVTGLEFSYSQVRLQENLFILYHNYSIQDESSGHNTCWLTVPNPSEIITWIVYICVYEVLSSWTVFFCHQGTQ